MTDLNNEKKSLNDKNSDIDQGEMLDKIEKLQVRTKEENKSERGSVSYIKNIDLFDRLNIKRISLKRNTRKIKTQKCPQLKFNIEKFTDEITRITEKLTKSEFSPIKQTRGDGKKKTIRFNNKKVTYQYAKGEEMLGVFDAIKDAKSLTDDNLELNMNNTSEKAENEQMLNTKDSEEISSSLFNFDEHQDNN